ncbi:hypothetical protein [Streptomyces sp. NPDC057494]|uniref:hypothetical protein n=1 Tax=Streptomyces sp. NPDC057494 TaxID=3346148 RepID=UPI00368490AD
MRTGDLVVVRRDDDLHFGEVTGRPESGAANNEDDYARRRGVRWLGSRLCPSELRPSTNRHPTVQYQDRNAEAFRDLARDCDASGGGTKPRAAEAAPVKVGRLTLVPYTRQDADVSVAQAAPVAADATKVTRAHRLHRTLLGDLADAAVSRDLRVWTGRDKGHAYDLLWSGGGALTLCEVKSLTEENETDQLREAIGQLLDYADDFRPKELRRLAGAGLDLT